MVATTTEFKPDFISPPGETIQDLLDEKSMSQAELAERMGRPVKTVNEIIKGKAAITPETSLQLERVLGVPASFWLTREQNYRERLARLREAEDLERHVKWMWETFPLKQMCDLGWLEGYSRRKDKQIDLLRNLLQFFGTASPREWETIWLDASNKASFRKSLRYESRPGAVAAWLRKGEIDAVRIQCESFKTKRFKSALFEIRRLTTTSPDVFVPRTVELCASSGVAFVLTPQVRGARVSGATRWLDPNKALIQLSLRYKTDDQFWFTFFHEAAHLILHGKREVFLEGIGDPEQAQQEKEANELAAHLLVPDGDFDEFSLSAWHKSPATKEYTVSERAVKRFARRLGVAPGIIVGRLQHEKMIPFSHLNGLKRSFEWTHRVEKP